VVRVRRLPEALKETEGPSWIEHRTDRKSDRTCIEIYADISCPFAHLSLHTVKRLRDQVSPEVPLVIRAWPLELINGAPLDPNVTARHVAELRRDVAPGLFAGFRREIMPASTLKALALVEAANDLNPWVGERISLELRDVLFEHGQRVDDRVVRLLAVENGLNPSVVDDLERVESRLDEGRRRGVRGSPHYFVGEAGLFCPLLDIEEDAFGGLNLQEQLERLQLFLFHGRGS